MVSATSLTDVADAYLVDHTVVDRVVVVAALGSYAAPDGIMAGPNGDMDPWADWIVAQRFRYIQVSAYYDQTGDVTAAEIPSLPQNPLGARMAYLAAQHHPGHHRVRSGGPPRVRASEVRRRGPARLARHFRDV